MAYLIYARVSTDHQVTERQRHVLAEAGLALPSGATRGVAADGTEIRWHEDPRGVSTKIPALDRPAALDLFEHARGGDVLVVSELFRLCRDTADILRVIDHCRAHGVQLRVVTGALSGFVDLAADDPTVTMVVSILASVGQFQRDLQNELVRDGVSAARAAGRIGGRRPAANAAAVRADWHAGITSIAALARRHGVSRGAIRTALDGLLPGQRGEHAERQALDTDHAIEVHTVAVPGVLAEHLSATTWAQTPNGPIQRSMCDAWHHARQVRRGQGTSWHVTATADVHAGIAECARELAEHGTDTERRAARRYLSAVTALTQRPSTTLNSPAL